MKSKIYLDYNATTPIESRVAEAMKPFLYEHFGNPSSVHSFGAEAKKGVETARRQVAAFLNCQPEEVIFTSGGTESNNYALKGVAFGLREKGNHIITTAIEHPAVIEVCKFLEKSGFRVSYLPVDEWGVVSPQAIENELSPQTILVSVMHANNETGSIQPIGEIAGICKKNGVIFHSDAAQSAGKIPVDVQELGVDLLSVAGHKLYAPKGVGALFVKQGIKLQKLMHGADHERNWRSGTENTLEIAGLGKACEIAAAEMEKNMAHLRSTRDRLHEALKKEIPELKLNGHPENRLPNTLNISFPKIEANTLLYELQQVAASAGAACHSDSIDVSPVLAAMHLPLDYAMGTIRFSTGKMTTKAEIDHASREVVEAYRRLRPSPLHKVEIKSQDKEIKLTHFTHGLGCACKLRPQDLEQVLKSLPLPTNPNILVGANTADDAAVYKISPETAIVKTLDFFTPIVDDPYSFGAIAAANALSDIYAMGAEPLFALNIVGFPQNRLPLSVLETILKGAYDKASQAGVAILGGHTVEDSEPKFGMSVTGIVHPEKVISNATAQPGDALILTKPIGLGIVSTALKRGLLSPEGEKQAIELMAQLNQKAAEVMRNYPVSACTDITGFGLLGHLREMCAASHAHAQIAFAKVPLIPEVQHLATAGIIPGGTRNNLNFVAKHVDFAPQISEIQQLLLADAQTSGGLLIALPQKHAQALLADLKSAGIADAAHIGNFSRKGEGRIQVSKI